MDPMSHAAPPSPTQQPMSSFSIERALGLLIIAVVPAVFWSVILYFGAPLFGIVIGLKLALAIGLGIAAFLGLIYALLAASN